MERMSQPSLLAVELRDSVLRVCIARPQVHNALSRDALGELAATFTRYAEDESIRAAVLTGAGEKSFAAGGDLKELVHVRSDAEARALYRDGSAALEAVRRFPAPTVAALNGVAVGGGAELALACDFRVAARHAKLGFVQATLGITTGFGGGIDLMQRLGAGRGLLHALVAESLEAGEALRAGLVDAVAREDETLEDCLARFLEPILTRPPQVLRGYKAMALAERLGESLERRQQIQEDAFARTWTHPDHWAAVERRAARKV
jgi:enoyl-CoA hydratase